MDKITLNQRLASEIETHYEGEGNQKQFAKDCGLSEGYISKLLNDDTDITNIRGIRELIIVAKELGVSVDYLLGLSDVKSSTQEAKNLDYIHEYTGLTFENINFVHLISSDECIMPRNPEYFLISHHREEMLDFLNFMIEITKNLIYKVEMFYNIVDDINNISDLLETLDQNDWNYLITQLNHNEHMENIFYSISSNSIKENKNSFELLIFEIINYFKDKLHLFLNLNQLESKTDSLIKFSREAENKAQDFYSSIEISELFDLLHSGKMNKNRKKLERIYEENLHNV